MKRKAIVSLEDRVQALRELTACAGSFVLMIEQSSKMGLQELHPGLRKPFEGLKAAYEKASIAINGEDEEEP